MRQRSKCNSHSLSLDKIRYSQTSLNDHSLTEISLNGVVLRCSHDYWFFGPSNLSFSAMSINFLHEMHGYAMLL